MAARKRSKTEAGKPETQQVGFRLPVSLIESIDRYLVEVYRKKDPMANRSDVVRFLLTEKLREIEGPGAPPAS